MCDRQFLIFRFLSTPSGWRATGRCCILYALPPSISIHALLVEGDNLVADRNVAVEDFYPRPPGGGRRKAEKAASSLQDISIHALRVEGDSAVGV